MEVTTKFILMADNATIGVFDIAPALETPNLYNESFEELIDMLNNEELRDEAREEVERRINAYPIERIDRAVNHVSYRTALVTAFLRQFGFRFKGKMNSVGVYASPA